MSDVSGTVTCIGWMKGFRRCEDCIHRHGCSFSPFFEEAEP
jgi:hypothetical protein